MALWGRGDADVADTLRAENEALSDALAIAEDRANEIFERHTEVCRQRRDDAETVCRAAVAEQDARIAWQADDNPTTRTRLGQAQTIHKAAIAQWRETQEGGA